MGVRALALRLGLVTAVVGGLVSTGGGRVAAASTNLLVNPDGQYGECAPSGLTAEGVPGWRVTSGDPGLVCYSAGQGFPSQSTPGASPGARAFFAGGGTGNGQLEQQVDLSSGAGAIDGGGVTFTLSGWLGGYASQNDRVGMAVTFLSGSGVTLGSATIPAVTNTNRKNKTEFLSRSANGTVPAGSRTAVVDQNFTWTAGNTTDGYANRLSLTVSTTITPPALATVPATVPGFDHVFLIYQENRNAFSSALENGADQYVYGSPNAPYTNGTLLPAGVQMSNLYATTHPSDPNYLAIAGGSVSGTTSNGCCGVVNATNLGDRLDAEGRTWKGYNQGANGACDLSTHGYTYPDDEPFSIYADIANNSTRCQQHIVPLSQLTTDLQSTSTTPNFAWFAADDCNDGEACGLAAADNFLQTTLPQIFSSPAWTSQRSLLIVAWDEGYTKSYGPNYPNQVAGILIGSQGTTRAGATTATRYTQYSLGRTVEAALGAAPMTTNDLYAQPVNDAWAPFTPSTIATSTPAVTQGSTVTFSYTTPTPSSTNWIGLYAPGNSPGVQGSTHWTYATAGSGSASFAADAGPGVYEAYLFANNGYSILAGPVVVTVT